MQITQYNIKGNVPRALTAAVVADLHNKPCDAVLSALSRIKPDIILIPGDLYHKRQGNSENAEKFLREAVKLAPVFFSPGNHERVPTDEMKRTVAESGAVLLDDSEAVFDFAGGKIRICGLSSGFGMSRQGHFVKTPPPNAEALRRFAAPEAEDGTRGYRILLCHHPEYYPDFIKPTNIELTVSGHAHGGQIRLFGRGTFAPGQGLFPKYTSGLIDGRFVISRGLANNSIIPRLFNPRQLVIIKITPFK